MVVNSIKNFQASQLFEKTKKIKNEKFKQKIEILILKTKTIEH